MIEIIEHGTNYKSTKLECIKDGISRTKYNKGYDIRYKLTGIGTDYYKRLNKLFLNISKTKIDILIEIIKERPLAEQETIMLEIADKLSKCTDTRYSINKQKK